MISPSNIARAEELLPCAERPKDCADWLHDGLPHVGSCPAHYRPAVSQALQDKDDRIAEMEKALEPFAAMAGEYDEHEDDGFEIWRDFSPLILALRITVGQARKARAALAAKESV